MAVIAAAVFQYDSPVDGVGLLQYVVGKGKGQSVTSHDDFNIQVLVAVISQYFRHFAFGLAALFGPFRNGHEDAGAAAGAGRFIQGNIDILPDPFVVRTDEATLLFPLERPDQGLIRPLDNADNFPFRFMAATAALNNAHGYLVVIHGRMPVLLGNVNIVLHIFAEDKSKGRRISLVYAYDFLSPLRCAVAFFGYSHETPPPYHLFKGFKQFGQLPAGQMQPLGAVLHGNAVRFHITYIHYIMGQLQIHTLYTFPFSVVRLHMKKACDDAAGHNVH